MFGRASGPGRLEVDRLCAEVVEAAQHPKGPACGDKVNQLVKLLESRRQDNLAALGSGLDMRDIEKAYTALSWLLRDHGGVSVPDQTRAAVFRALALLAEDWYPAWATDDMTNFKRWKTLIGLGIFLLLRGTSIHPPASASGSAPKSAAEKAKLPPSSIALGESTRIAIFEFLHAMLKPRTEKSRHSDSSSKSKDPWEWDGVSELPSLQEALDFFEYDPDLKSGTGAASTQGTIQTIFPTRKHTQWVAQSTETSRLLMQICVLSLDSSANPDFSELLRATALKAARTTFTTWLAGVDQGRLDEFNSKGIEARDTTFDKPSLELAIKAQSILPGMVSALVKILTGRGTGVDAGKANQALPSKAGLAPLALETLAETTLLGFNDRATARVRLSTNPKLEANRSVSTLAELAELASRMSTAESDAAGADSEPTKDPSMSGSNSQDQGMPPQAQMFYTSTKRIIGALRQVFSTFSNPHNIHHATLGSALNMAASLWLRCGDTFAWAESLSEAQDSTQGSLSEDLVRLIIDITATSTRISSAVEAQGWDMLLALVGFDASRSKAEVAMDRAGLKALWSIDRISSSALEQLSTAIHSDDEQQVVLLAHRVKIAAQLFQRVAEAVPPAMVADLLKPGPLQVASPLSLLTLIFASGSVLGNKWTSHPVFVRWSSSLLSELQVADDTDIAVADGAAGINLRLQKLESDEDAAIRSALTSISAALTSAWSIRTIHSSEQSKSAAAPRLSASKSVEDNFAFIFHFLRDGSRFRTTRLTVNATFARQMCSSALFVADILLKGVADQLAAKRSRSATAVKIKKKAAKKLGKLVTHLVRAMLEEDMDEAMDPDNVLALITERHQQSQSVAVDRSDPSSSSTVGFRKGFSSGTASSTSTLAAESSGFLEAGLMRAVSLEDQKSTGPAASAMVTQEKALRQVDVANALLLNILATAAELLGRDFEPNLIGLIYPLVCASTANASVVRSAGQSALARIAAACGYGSSTQALRACADWIVSATSQRIVTDLGLELELVTQMHTSSSEQSLMRQSGGTGTDQLVPMVGTLGGCALPLGSAQAAPFVLVEFVRLVGTEALASVEDAVDEVLDALDRYHGYEEICEGLLGVLRALLAASVDSLAASKEAGTLPNGERAEGGPSSLAKQEWLPKPDTEMTAFEQWFKGRREPERLDFDFEEEEEKMSSQAKGDGTSKSEDSNTKAKRSGEETLNPPPSRSQQVVADILEKSVAFLGHSSAHIRAQVLRLLGYGVSVLAPQRRELELIPVLNRAWPLVLARLGSSATTPGSGQAGHRLNSGRIRGAKRQKTMMGKRSESEPFVWLEAVKLVAVLAEHSADHFGQKIVDDVWPRLQLLLSELAQAHPVRQTQKLMSGQKATTTRSPIQVSPLFIPDEHSVGCRLLLEVLIVLRLTIRGVSIHLDETQAWMMACDPIVLGALHRRQAVPIRRAAEGLFMELGSRNADAVWLLLREFVGRRVQEGQEEMVTSAFGLKYLRAFRPELELELEHELWERILCELKCNHI
ncbi:unnamed protein product [Tilletia controversa]|uniref:TTI1 C-terminal TPR domain-containing protein n=3 Tax=Tilletia TaxID=13289 RepID=A0A8X7MXQ1_9BASI|nr:hypothetical protein CF336_g3629 [Tilletia laevis]KAE8202180.1 hypothetical protein CF328_g2366 [Tilletia controversa]KAE8261543.1 hypothetical protein A4X03_0g3167 [Tilletia caries]KAE8202007.1 hypothetical protein CF335_g3577 [Tilletia laevis]KAE8252952.1 hypothetical protein A4X06_0g1802 [Tilletia controversa]